MTSALGDQALLDFMKEIAALPDPVFVPGSPASKGLSPQRGVKRGREAEVTAVAVDVLPKPKETPAEARLARRVLKDADPEKDMTPTRLATIRAGMAAIVACTPSTADRLASEVRVTVAGLSDDEMLVSPEVLKRVDRFFNLPGKNWVGEVLRGANRASSSYFVGVDITHCSHHLLPTGEIKEHVINPETGISAGNYEGLYSTFFPEGKDLEWFTSKMLGAEWIKSSNPGKAKKSLCKMVDGEKSFYAIRVLKESCGTIRTCFPLFYASYFDRLGDKIEVPGVFSITKSDVLDFLNREKRGHRLKNRTELTLASGHLLVNLDGMHGIPFHKKLVYLFIHPLDLD